MKNFQTFLLGLSLLLFWGCVTGVDQEDIGEFYNAGNEQALGLILDNPEKLENPEDIAEAREYYKDLREKRIKSEIAEGIANEDIGVLERIISGEYGEYVSEEQREAAAGIYKKLQFQKVEAEVAEAVNTGNCAKLYEYAVEKSDAIDPRQARKAAQFLRSYKNPDSAVMKYKHDKMSRAVRTVSDDMREKVFSDPEKFLPALAKELSRQTTDKFQSVKNIHDWICDTISYDTEDYFQDLYLPQDYRSVLKRKTAVCAGYSELFRAMCDMAGFEVTTINGYSKGFGYRGAISRESAHAWNAIKINNKWRLVDCTWDAGYVDRETFIKEYSTEYLFINSRDILYSHLPEADRYQFYYPFVTKEQFVSEPLIKGAFFQYGLSLIDDSLRYENIAGNGPFTLELISANRNIVISSNLRTPDQTNVNGGSFCRRDGRNYQMLFSPPDTAAYEGNVFARLNTENNFPTKIGISKFEDYYLPEIEKIIEDKEYDEELTEVFIQSYFKVPENNSYYFIEDQFDTRRNSIVEKLFKDLDDPNQLRNVLNFNIRAGNQVEFPVRYPQTLLGYMESRNTELQEPLQRVLISGALVDFKISSTDYRYFAIIDDTDWNYFEKDSSGSYTLQYQIPDKAETITIYAGKSKTGQYRGIIQYFVE